MTVTDNILSTLTGNPGIHPRDFRNKWKITGDRLAELLRRNPRTISRYLNNKTQPPEEVELFCWLLDYYITHQNDKKRS